MTSLNCDRLNQLGHPRMLVIGDAMLDRYTWGRAERVSPEAPVLVLRADDREVRLGGAASVAMLLRGLEVEATLGSVVGDDHDGRTIRRLIDEAGIDASALLCDPDRPTTTKDRFLGRSDHRQPHQMLRVDTESNAPLDSELTAQMINVLTKLIPQHAAVLISDYAKGVCTEPLLTEIISVGREAGVPILVDPGRGVDFEAYRGATLIKPNRLEAELAFGCPISSPDEALKAAVVLRERYGIETVLITLDRDGLVFATSDKTEHQPITPRAICDITGAGDMVLATLGLGLAAGMSVSAAAAMANVAAGLEVAQPGVTPIPRADLFRELAKTARFSPPSSMPVPKQESKLVTLEIAQRLADEYRRDGRVVVFTNGCFDLLHVGHVSMLEESAQLGDVLFVAINSDKSVQKLKGPTRPIIDEDDRARMLAALGCVDPVMIFEDSTPHRLLNAIRPDILVKGGTTGDIVGREVVEAYDGRIIRLSDVPHRSTTRLVQQIQCQKRPGVRSN